MGADRIVPLQSKPPSLSQIIHYVALIPQNYYWDSRNPGRFMTLAQHTTWGEVPEIQLSSL
jgi:hypothetical protein